MNFREDFFFCTPASDYFFYLYTCIPVYLFYLCTLPPTRSLRRFCRV